MFDCGVVRMCLWLILYELDYAYASWCIAFNDDMYAGIGSLKVRVDVWWI
jgi:hypothetical protein